jgi:hypothetical protein
VRCYMFIEELEGLLLDLPELCVFDGELIIFRF